MGRMWKYEPEDFDDKSHLKGKQFGDINKYTPAVTRGYDFDNDGNPVFPDTMQKKETKQEYGKRTGTAAWNLKNEHKFKKA